MNKFKKSVFFVFLVFFLVIVSGCGNRADEIINDDINVIDSNVLQINQNNSDNQNDINEEDWKDAEEIYSSADYDYTDWKTYINEELGYSVKYPADWRVNDVGLSALTKELIIEPLKPEPFVGYISVSLLRRSLEVERKSYVNLKYWEGKIYKEDRVIFADSRAYYYHDFPGENYDEGIVVLGDDIFRLSTSRAQLLEVKQILSSFEFK